MEKYLASYAPAWCARALLTPILTLALCLRPAVQCTHYFHLMCITTWLHNKNSCPVCRRKWEFASAPKPAPATPGARNRGEGSGFGQAAIAGAAPEVVEAD